MPKMTIAWVLIYAVMFCATFINPLFGTLGYLFEYYLRPSLNWWGAWLPDLRWNLAISGALTLAFFLRRSSLPDIGAARRAPAACLVGLLLVMTLVTPTTAVNRERSVDSTINFAKLILFHGLMVGTIRTELAFDAVVGMHMAGATWWGWEAYRNPKRSAGRLQNVGSGDTRGDNGTAAHLLTVLPFIAAYLAVHRDKRLRLLALVAAPLVINTLVLCNSRGATLGVIAALGVALWVSKSGHRIRMIGSGLAFAVCLYALADPQFIARQQQTNYENDGSATGRLEAWSGAVDLVKDYPFGAGGAGFYELSPVYAPELVERMREKRDPHNTFVLVASEWGIPGLALFLGYIWSVMRLLRDVRKTAIGPMWYYRSVAIQLSMVGLLVAGCFTDRFYAEAPYWMGALAVALHRLHAHQRAQAPVVEKAPVEPAIGPIPIQIPRPV